MALSRRETNLSLISVALAGLATACRDSSQRGTSAAAPLRADPARLLDLPEGFTYRLISRLGEIMSDGEAVPDRADGMGTFPDRDGNVILIRNHELPAGSSDLSGSGFDTFEDGKVLPGGTTTIIYDPRRQKTVAQFRSLAGTIRNCSGGVTPWRTWLTCEEDVTKAGEQVARDHGWVFEVPADIKSRAQPTPLTGLGRFRHEAAAVDPASGIVFLTEDRDDSLLYRFIPSKPGRLRDPGRLQALAIDGLSDTRNWHTEQMPLRTPYRARWIDLDRPESPDDDLRIRGATAGACLFARGEGIVMGRGEIYFTCTSGGSAKLGQVMRYRLSPFEGSEREKQVPGSLDLFFESKSKSRFYYGDNIAMAPNGDLLVCDDQPGDIVDNHVRAIRPDGTVYDFARLRMQTEPAGLCFSPDSRTMFINAYSPTHTFAVTGPFHSVIGV